MIDIAITSTTIWGMRDDDRAPTRGPMIVLSLLVFVGVFTYRFNALLGSLSGFDGDHFIYYLGSMSVLRGERPLRDFVDAGLQGAWPALTYELSALAQQLGGESLLSEAVLCVGAVALSATLLFRAAASVAGVWASLVVTLVSVATSPVFTAITRSSCLRWPSSSCCVTHARLRCAISL